jgi:hypothetical protein
MMNIINLTQHPATAEQVAAGVVEPADKPAVQALLTFEDLPTAAEIRARALALATIAVGSGALGAMIGGAPFFMAALEGELTLRSVVPLYSFSRREAVEERLADGGTRKVSIFRHAGFVAGLSTRHTADIVVLTGDGDAAEYCRVAIATTTRVGERMF